MESVVLTGIAIGVTMLIFVKSSGILRTLFGLAMMLSIIQLPLNNVLPEMLEIALWLTGFGVGLVAMMNLWQQAER